MKEENEMAATGFTLSAVVIGAAVGAAIALLFAPKAGSEIRDDLADWSKKGRDKGSALLEKIGEYIPTKVKGAAVVGAVKSGGKEAFHEVKDKLGDAYPH